MPFKGQKNRTSQIPRNGLERGIDRAFAHLHQLDREGLEKVAEKLCDERATLSAILENLQEAVIVVDAWGTIEISNPSAEQLLGLSKEKERNNTTLWRAAPELAKILKVASSGALTLTNAFTQELELHYPSLRVIRLFAAPIAAAQERFLIVLSDTTHEREDSERNIEDARLGALTQLSAGVAHELGNPLNALQIHLQVLERALEKEKISPKVKTIHSSLKIAQGEVARLDQIIRNFLQAIRPSTPNLQPTDLIAVLEEVLAVLQAEFKGAGISVEVELPGITPVVMADAEQLKQVYFNILKNAKEASHSGGVLHIRAATDDEFFTLHFTDSGTGISSENLTHLFEPYRTTKPGGTGLGLMIAQKIMRAHHGSIRVESRENTGTTVSLIFPLKYRRWKPLQASNNNTPPPALPK